MILGWNMEDRFRKQIEDINTRFHTLLGLLGVGQSCVCILFTAMDLTHSWFSVSLLNSNLSFQMTLQYNIMNAVLHMRPQDLASYSRSFWK